MYLDRKISDYILFEEETIQNAVRKITRSKGMVVFIVSERDVLKGVVTNGDVLRWISSSDQPDLSQPISTIANTNYLFDDISLKKSDRFLESVFFVPIVNDNHQLIAVASRFSKSDDIKIGDFSIGKVSSTFVIAEIGNNHNGNLKLAKQLVDECQKAGADCAKFQMRNLKKLYANAGNPDDMKENLGSQYTLDLLTRFQLTDIELFEVFDYCKSKGILPLCTPWDGDSLQKLEDYGMPAYKVASADLTNHDLLRLIAETGKPLICSTGMSTEAEIKESVKLMERLGVDHIVLHCNSTYPAPFADINLNYIKRLQEILPCPIGYSGHERDINVSIAAVALGAKVIERHITVDRSMEGSDHKASLLPYEFKKMVDGIRQVEVSLGSSSERKLSQGEMINRVNLAKSLVTTRDLKKGEVITADMVDVKSPGRGLQPNYKEQLIGSIAKHDFAKGDFFYPSDIQEEVVERRNYVFRRPWGVPVRYHDYKEMLEGTNMDFIEFHLSYKDLEVDIDKIFITPEKHLGFVVHCPELFANDHTLDLTSTDEGYRNHSIREVQRVIDITRNLNRYFPRTKKPLIVTNVGGFTSTGFMNKSERIERLAILENSLQQLDMNGVEIIPQTMPPFPWHFGGQQYHNLFMEADEIVSFCQKNDMRICLDTSHSMLACAHHHWSFYEFLEKTAPYTAYIHFADSENTGGEGLQIGEGEVDFHACSKVLNDLAPNAPFIPEVWQGHENRGEGFWIALEKLEGLF